MYKINIGVNKEDNLIYNVAGCHIVDNVISCYMLSCGFNSRITCDKCILEKDRKYLDKLRKEGRVL